MKHFSLVATLIFVLVLFSCGAKEEKTEEVSSSDNAIVDETLDTNAAYEGIVSDGLSDESTTVDSNKMVKMVYTEPSKEIQIDPPVDKKKEVATIKEPVKETVKEPKKEPIRELPKETVKTHENRYYVVAGSFKKYSNAQNLFNYFHKKGYNPLILPKVNGYNRVAIISYSSEDAARRSVKKLRAEHNELTFWLYRW